MDASMTTLGNYVSSSSSGTFSTSSTTLVDVTNLSVTIASSGRPVFVGLIHDGGSNRSYVQARDTVGNTASADVVFLRDSTSISINALETAADTPGSMSTLVPVSSFNIIDIVAAGTYTYKVQIKTLTTGGADAGVFYAKLVAYEI